MRPAARRSSAPVGLAHGGSRPRPPPGDHERPRSRRARAPPGFWRGRQGRARVAARSPPGSAGRCRRQSGARPAAGLRTSAGGAAAAAAASRASAGFEVVGRSDEPVKLEGSDRVRVLLRAEGGRVGTVRAFSEDCPLDAGGLPLVWIEDVRPADSVALLVTLVGQPSDGATSGKRLDDGALAAIASHADPSADAALERFVAPEQPLELRKQAAFWMGQARGARGYEVLAAPGEGRRRPALPRARRLRAHAEPRAGGDRRDHRRRPPRPGRARARPGALLAGPERRAPRARGDPGRARRRPRDRGEEEGRLRAQPAAEGRGRAAPDRASPRPTRATRCASRRCSGSARAGTRGRSRSSRTC